MKYVFCHHDHESIINVAPIPTNIDCSQIEISIQFSLLVFFPDIDIVQAWYNLKSTLSQE